MKKVISFLTSLPVLLALFYIVFMTPLMGRKMGYTVDATPSFQLTRAIVETGDLFPRIPVKQGYIYSLVFAPFYLVGEWISGFYPQVEEGWIERKLLCWMNTLITAMTLALLALTLKQMGFSRRAQVWVPLLYGLSTLAFAYARYDYNKCLAAFLLLFTFYFFVKGRTDNKPSSYLGCGIATGLLAALRLELAVVSPVYLWDLFWNPSLEQDRMKKNFSFLLPLAAGVIFVLLYNIFYWSGSAAGGYEGEGSFSGNPLTALVGFLFSPGKSMFLFNPVLFLLPLALRPFKDKVQSLFWIWVGSLLVIVLVYSLWEFWWGGWSFGARHLVPILPLAVLPLAALIDQRSTSTLQILLFLGVLGLLEQILCNAIDFNDVIMTLMNSGISEQQLIWMPIWSPLLHHLLFLRHMPLARWDYAIVAIGQSWKGGVFVLGLIVWVGILGTIGFGLWRASRQEAV